MEKKPTFSILVPVYNQVGKMDACIESIKGQTEKDFEVVLVDDGSTDSSFEMLKGWQEKDERVSVYRHEKNKSLLCARLTGMEHAQGKYVLFLDSDDFLAPDTLEKIRGAFEETGADIVRFGIHFEEREIKELFPYSTEDVLRSHLEGKFPPAIMKNAYTAEVIRTAHSRITPFYCNMGEDSFLGSVFYSIGEKYAVLNDCLYNYVEGGMSNEVSLSLEKYQRAIESARQSGHHLIDYIKQYAPEYEDLAVSTFMRMLHFILRQYIFEEKDYRRIFAYLEEVRGKEQEAFLYACEKLLSAKILNEIGETVKFNFDLSVKE